MSAAVDFLPADYVCVQTRRIQARWRRLSLLVLTALVAWGVVNESYRRMQGEETRYSINQRLRSIHQQLSDPAALQAELEQAEGAADALAALELSVKPSRIIAAISKALPPETRLTHFKIASDSGPEFEPAVFELADASTKPPAPGENAAPKRTGLIRVRLRGVAREEALIARLVDQIEQTKLFLTVHLRRIELSADNLREFDIHLTVEPPVRVASAPLRIRQRDANDPGFDLPDRLVEEVP